MSKKIKYVKDEVIAGRYVRAWKQGRNTIVVQVWNSLAMEGEPAGDWDMPSVLGLETCIEQALLQTPAEGKP